MTKMLRLEALVVECCVCRLQLEQLPGTAIADALRSFRAHHPMTAAEQHVRRLPAGWREPLSGPGSLSQ